MEITGRRDEVHLARPGLGDDLLEAVGRALHGEVLHLHVAVVRHLRLEAFLAADLHGAHRYAERLAVAPDALHYLDEAFAEDARAYLVGQLGI